MLKIYNKNGGIVTTEQLEAVFAEAAVLFKMFEIEASVSVSYHHKHTKRPLKLRVGAARWRPRPDRPFGLGKKTYIKTMSFSTPEALFTGVKRLIERKKAKLAE